MREKIDPHTGEVVKLQDEHGWEIPDPTPLRLPTGFKKPETLADQVRRLVRSAQFQMDLDKAGLETFDEADDFEVDDDFDPSTPYETFFDPVLGKDITPMEFKQHEETYKKRYLKAQEQYFNQVDAENILAENLARARHRERQAAKPTPPDAGSEGSAPPK